MMQKDRSLNMMGCHLGINIVCVNCSLLDISVILLERKHLGTTVTQPQSRRPAKITERVKRGALGVLWKGFPRSSLTSYITASPEKRWTEWCNAHHH